MKNYIVFDNYSEYTDIRNYKELKELLFEEEEVLLCLLDIMN